MVIILRNDNSLKVTNKSKINSFSSISNNLTFYISKEVNGWKTKDCDVIISMCDNNGKVYMAKMDYVEDYKGDYYRYSIKDEADFSLSANSYTLWISLLNYNSTTHISSNTVEIYVTETKELDAISSYNCETGLFDKVMKRMNEVENSTKEALDKIMKMTQMNIQINKEIEEKVKN